MSDRNWDKELAKIDKHLSSISDDELLERKSAAAPQRVNAAAVASSPALPSRDVPAASGAAPSPWGVYLRVGLAVALAVGVPFWPYASRCGLWLSGFLATLVVLVAAGTWAAIATWRARAARLHVVALLVMAWGVTLVAKEILPRVGYAKDGARTGWVCQ